MDRIAARPYEVNERTYGVKRFHRGRTSRACGPTKGQNPQFGRRRGKLNSRGWGKTNKGLLSYLAEHVFVVEDRLHLGVSEASGIAQRFVHTFRGTGIQYEEYIDDAKVDFTVMADHDFTDAEWATIWLCGEPQGIGASRSQATAATRSPGGSDRSDGPRSGPRPQAPYP